MISKDVLKIIDVDDPSKNKSKFVLNMKVDDQFMDFEQILSATETNNKFNLEGPYVDLPSLQCIPKTISSSKTKEQNQDFSLYLFSSKGKLRNHLQLFNNSEPRKYLLRIVTILNAIALLAFSYEFRVHLKKQLTLTNILSLNLQLFCNVIFTLEVLIGIIEQGAIIRSGSYLRNGWNVLSLFCTISCWIQLLSDPIANGNDLWYQLFCSVSAFRILKLVETFQVFRLPFEAFLRTIPALGQTLFPLAIFLLFYAIIGLHLMQGAIQYRCKTTPLPYHGKWIQQPNVTLLCGSWPCPQGTYCGSNYDAGLPRNQTQFRSITYAYGLFNFDNFFLSCLTVSHYVFLQSWSNILFYFSHHINHYIAAVYFFTLAILLFYTISNLLLVSLNKSFAEQEKAKDAQKKLKVRNMNSKRKKFSSIRPAMKQSLINSEEAMQSFKSSNIGVKHTYPRVQLLSTVLILLSFVVIGYDYHGITSNERFIIGVLDLVLTILLFVETIIRLVIQKKQFFKEGTNRLDIIVMTINIVELIMCASTNTSVIVNTDPIYQLLRGSKLLRLMRIYFQNSLFKYQRQIIRIFVSTMKRMIHFLIMWIFIALSLCVVAMVLFGYKARNGKIPNFTNFQGVYNSMISVLMVFLNENWYETSKIFFSDVGWVSIIFYLASAFIGHMMLLRLFLAQFLQYLIQQIREQDKSEQKLMLQQRSQIQRNNMKTIVLKKLNSLHETTDMKDGAPGTITENSAYYMVGSPAELREARSRSTHQIQPRVHFQDTEILLFLSYNNIISEKCRVICQSEYYRWLSYLTLIVLFVRFCICPIELSVKPLTILSIDYTLSCIFILEVIINVIGYGILGSQGYIKRAWINPIHILVFISTIVSLILPYPSDSIFQKLKSLRFIFIIHDQYIHHKEMKYMIQSLSALMGKIIKMLMLYFLFLFIVAIIPTKLTPSMQSCVNTHLTWIPSGQTSCMDWGGDWVVSQQSFDNLLSSWLLLYQMATCEGWAHLLSQTVAQGPGWKVFFALFVFIGNFCMLSVFVGLIVQPYLELKTKAKKMNLLTPAQKTWFLIKNGINELLPQPILQEPKNNIAKLFYKFINAKAYQNTLDVVACLNAVFLAMNAHRASDFYTTVVEILNLVCIIIFSLDTVFKIIVASTKYFNLQWSKLELAALCCNILHFSGLPYYFLESYDKKVIWTISVALQLARCFKLLLKFMWTRALLNAVFEIIPKCTSVLKILVVTLLFYSVLGTHIFPYLKPSKALDNYDTGFTNIFTSTITLLKIASGQTWYEQVSAASRGIGPNFVCNQINTDMDFQVYGQTGCGTLWAYPYFFSFHLIFSVIILNLLVATMLSAYGDNYEKEYNSVSVFQLGDTLTYWQKYDPKGLGTIPYKKFWRLSSQIAIIFGIKKEYLIVQQNKERLLKQLNIPAYQRQDQKMLCFRFHDVIAGFSKLSMFIKTENNCDADFEVVDPKIAQQLAEVETKIPESLYSDLTKVPNMTSSKLLIVFKTLKKLRNWRNMALNKQPGQLSEVLDILRMKGQKDQNKERILNSNIAFLDYADDEAVQLTS